MAKPLTPTERSAIIAALRDGGNIGKVAADFRRSNALISRIAHEEGISVVSSMQEAHAVQREQYMARRTQVKSKMLDLVEQGLSRVELCLKFDPDAMDDAANNTDPFAQAVKKSKVKQAVSLEDMKKLSAIAKDIGILSAVFIDKIRLEEGKPTSRIDTIGSEDERNLRDVLEDEEYGPAAIAAIRQAALQATGSRGKVLPFNMDRNIPDDQRGTVQPEHTAVSGTDIR